MSLAGIIARHEDLMICDLAETYGILDYRRLPPRMVATLVSGLRDTSRLVMEHSGSQANTEYVLLAYIADKIANLVWMFSDDGRAGKNAPERILPIITGQKKPEERVSGYRTPEEFERALKKAGGE